jgi:maltooligosyltrehalose synthase
MDSKRSASTTTVIARLARANFGERPKMLATHGALQFRRAQEPLFRDGDYVQLRIERRPSKHVFALRGRLAIAWR